MNALEITKEIILAAIEKEIIVFPTAEYESDEQIKALNIERAEELGKVFKTIAKSVHEANSKNFDFE
ncbi:hypothetical protein J2TS6_54800 [Paenibacillus albilobatus]|uniref:Uncharacterized protein n=1 Tax=Paenibacillus albilobatus TaxID=2716884 RepID=A0A919XKE6_9BACL|nr:hypothetical protein [Paenibacillus albilobatus]GIO34339.1 hypothetical protein J2TS6_54800 [Paenibacillus albilobatus]